MRIHPCHLVLAFSVLCSVAHSQTAVTGDGSGVAGNIPKYTGTASLTSSAITEVNGNVGIGTSTPLAPLDVRTAGASAGITLAGFNYAGANVEGMAFNRGVLDGTIIDSSRSAYQISNVNTRLEFEVYHGNGASVAGSALVISNTGNVGVGTPAPGTDLAALATPPAANTPIFEVNGDIALSQGTGGMMYYADGTVQSTAWNGTTVGGDYAEAIDVLGDRAGYEPGDVIVIDAAETGKFAKSEKAYSRMVAGVYSTKPGLVGRRTTTARTDKAAEVPMAMMGIVPTKVSAENGPIERGDLLVSASKPGYAMKGTDRDRLTGAVIGKALAPMAEGVGVIEVLLALQ